MDSFQQIYKSKEFKEVLANKPAKFPYIVDIEMTNLCNLKCVFCGQQSMTRPKGFMPKKIFKKVVDECAVHNTPIRLIRWGEPFLHPDIIPYCKYIKKKGLPLHITTNGLLLEDKMQDLIDMELDSIIFSFQGADKERYEQMRGKHYDELKNNVIKFVKMRWDNKKPYITITSTMTNETEREIEEFRVRWENIVDEVKIGKTNLSRVPNKLKAQETIRHFYKPCTEVWQKLSVDWDGKVSACCADWDNFMTIGDVNKQTLKDIWDNSEDLKVFRKLLGQMKHKSLTMCSVCFKTYDF